MLDINETLGYDCPGCDVPITYCNDGGYRTYCDRCVSAMPRLPGGTDERGFQKGYHIEGRYPEFRWVES